MFGSVEPRVRRIVSERLGVGMEDLAPEVSLTDDLAADSLDLLDLAVAIESELGIELSEPALEGVRTYGDLVRLTIALFAERACDECGAAVSPAVLARVVVPGRQTVLERSVALTPYMAETIAEDAGWAGRGARVEITVPPDVSDSVLASVEQAFARSRALGIEVQVFREAAPCEQGRESAPPRRRPSSLARADRPLKVPGKFV